MKRPSSAPRSYLQQLAAPLPHAAVLLHAPRPVKRGAGSILDTIPPVVDSVDSVHIFADQTGRSDPLAEASLHDAHRNVLFSARSTSRPPVQGEATSVPAAPVSAAAWPTTSSSHVEDIPHSAALRRPSQRSAATGEATLQGSTRLDPEPAPQLYTVSLRRSVAEPSSFSLASSSASHAEGKRSRGGQVHIGTVEVRVAAPPPRPQQPSANQHRDPISNDNGRPAHAEPLSRGLAWSHGLVQG